VTYFQKSNRSDRSDRSDRDASVWYLRERKVVETVIK
jgi:hypothetical protein